MPVAQDSPDGLTDIAMPRLANEPRAEEALEVLGLRLPVRRCEALVLGSGAAGLRAAVELKRRNFDVVIATPMAGRPLQTSSSGHEYARLLF